MNNVYSVKQVKPASSHHQLSKTDAALALVPGVVVAGMRAVMLGRPPFTDDGWYASVAWCVHRGLEPVVHSPVTLYPRLFSWVFSEKISQPLLWMRVADGIIASWAAIALYILLRVWVRPVNALVISLAWALCVNHPKFVDAGFKNQIMAATLFLIVGLWAVLRVGRGCRIAQARASMKACAVAGIAAALAVCMREAFVPFAVVLMAACAMRGGVKGTAWFVGAGVITGVTCLSFVAGGVSKLGELVSTWRETAAALANLGEIMKRPWDGVFIDSAKQAWLGGGWAVPISALAIGFAVVCAFEMLRPKGGRFSLRVQRLTVQPTSARLMPFIGLGLVVAPLPEMLAKLAFAYHFSLFALGVAILCAWMVWWINHGMRGPSRQVMIAGMAVTLLCGLWPIKRIYNEWMWGYNESNKWWPVMVLGEDHPALIKDSFYLRLTQTMKDHARPGGGDTVMLSGFYFGPLAFARVDPVAGFAVDGAFLACMPRDGGGGGGGSGGWAKRAAEAIANKPPRMVVESSRIQVDLSSLIPGFPGGYTLVDDLRPGEYQSYGPYDARVWVRKD